MLADLERLRFCGESGTAEFGRRIKHGHSWKLRCKKGKGFILDAGLRFGSSRRMLRVREVFTMLAEIPHRGTGTHHEYEAREQLRRHLETHGPAHVSTELFFAPATYLPFFALIAAGAVAAHWLAPQQAVAGLVLGATAFLSHVLFFDWRLSPLIWLGPRRTTANLVARGGSGPRLLIVMAHLDSAPASFAYRPDQVKNFAAAIYLGTAIIGTGVVLPALALAGITLPTWVLAAASTAVLVQYVIACIDYLRFGFTPGANDNLSGVAAAVQTAARLWNDPPANTEVRLVITSAEEAGMLGARHYYRKHRRELHERETGVLNYDTLGTKNVRFIVQSGGFTAVRYENVLTAAAQKLSEEDPAFTDISSGRHHVGDFDSVWFHRGGLPALTIASYDDEGLMPWIHTPQDTADAVDLERVERAAAFGEAVARKVLAVE